ncbi:Sec14 cytosolic factor, partial [Trifolium medium]|nr:Sec14 cytosolic factor [Trifolium medium]
MIICRLVTGIDTSTAESRSEAEDNDIASPKTGKGYSHLSLNPVRDEVKGIDTSTAESRSKAEDNDITSPKAVPSYSHLRLTPVHEE